jgi:selenocysteine-specific elongation factor
LGIDGFEFYIEREILVRVIGTAGHVDHGKSTLIHALTGTHPDRLKEEQEREMTIVLGFAWWQLPNGEDVGVVDVPGHRDFIENMLSGVGGIDAALFVVAADEGVMPQTREHLAILDILQVQGGVVALTKIDAVDDPDWLNLVEEDVRQVIAETVLKDAPIIRVSAKEKTNLDELQSALEDVLSQHPSRPDLGRPRLPIDRVFTIAGFGTVVTGTLIDGAFGVGDEVVILPDELRGRVRGLQTHKQKEETAQPGSRTAMNISGVDVGEIQRGQVVVSPDTLKPSRRLDVQFRLLGDASQPLKHNDEVKLFIGAAEVIARVRLIGAKELKPGEEGWLQLELQEPTLSVRGDRYILRRPSPGETLGGGAVLDPHPKSRYKRFAPEVLERLEALTAGTPTEVFMQALLGLGVGPYSEVVKASHLEKDVADKSASELITSDQIIVLQGDPDKITHGSLIASRSFWEITKARSLNEVSQHHSANLLRRGMPREELKSRLGMDAQIFNLVVARLVEEGQIEEGGALINLPGHAISFSAKQKKKVDGLLARFAQSPFSPPTIKECVGEVGEDVYQALVDLDTLLPVSQEVVFRQEDYQAAVKQVSDFIKKNETLTLAQARDHLGTTRRYVQDLLEFMDKQGITVREGDARKLKA